MAANADSGITNAGRRSFLKDLPLFLFRQARDIATGAVFEGKKNAWLDVNRCLAWTAGNCQLCYLACPLRDRAMMIRDLKPVILTGSCDGCGMCAAACRTVNDASAIVMKEVP